jgi:hypothetical protein
MEDSVANTEIVSPLSRMNDLIGKTMKEPDGQLKQGHEYRVLNNIWGFESIGILTRWRDGRLNDDGDLAAVECQDAHIEHFKNGFLHNDERDENGNFKPAIIDGYGKKFEYWLNGKRIDQK